MPQLAKKTRRLDNWYKFRFFAETGRCNVCGQIYWDFPYGKGPCHIKVETTKPEVIQNRPAFTQRRVLSLRSMVVETPEMKEQKAFQAWASGLVARFGTLAYEITIDAMMEPGRIPDRFIGGFRRDTIGQNFIFLTTRRDIELTNEESGFNGRKQKSTVAGETEWEKYRPCPITFNLGDLLKYKAERLISRR